MHTTFQKLCIRPETGFAYDQSSMVQLADGGLFTELLCKITSKCDTSILLLSSHKGKMRDFAVKLIGLESPKTLSMSVTSAVLSSFRKGLSYLNGNNQQEEETERTDVEQVTEAWEEGEAAGYHGMQVLTLIDKEVMPDNDCRKLYNLHQFATITLQSINAYYMFQKPDVAFVYDSDFSTQQLKEAYPGADTFAVAVMWRFAENPTIPTGRIRPTPIVRSSIRTEASSTPTAVPRVGRLSIFNDSSDSIHLRTPLSTTTTSFTKITRKITKTRDSPQSLRKGDVTSPVTPKVLPSQMSEEQSSSDEDSPVVPANRSLPRRNLSATTRNNIFSPDRVRAPSPPPATVPASPVALKVPSPVALKVPSPVALKVPSPVALKVPCLVTTEVVVPSPVTTRVTARTPRSVSGKTAGTALAKVTSAVDTAWAASSATKLAASSAGGLDVAALAPHSVAVVGSRVKPGTPVKRPRFNTSEVVTITATSSRRGAAAVAATTEPFEEELPSVRRGRGTPRKEVVGRVTSNRRGTKRQQPEPEKEVEVEEEEQESDEAMETEVSFKPNAGNLAKKLIEMELTEEESNRTVTAAADQSNFNLASVTLPFDEPAAPKPRGGRKSMVASARKSLANEWPVEDQQHMLHFFDNLNPQQSETSRVALTCKYALIQYDRDLSSKLLYQWLERKDRVVNRQVTQFVLNEADQKNTVLELYRSLSIVPSEATKVSFTLKFIQAQYGVAVTSKQLFSWIKEKPKKGKK